MLMVEPPGSAQAGSIAGQAGDTRPANRGACGAPRPPPQRSWTAGRPMIAIEVPRRFASLVKIEHTVFALPFAYVGAFLAVNDVPSAHDLVWITLAMIGARSLAMA